jgi:hypothetical protein
MVHSTITPPVSVQWWRGVFFHAAARDIGVAQKQRATN